MLNVVKYQGKTAGRRTMFYRLKPRKTALGSVTRGIRKMAGKSVEPFTWDELRKKLGPNGGIYRDPSNALVALWDGCDSYLKLRPDPFSTDKSRVQLSLYANNCVASYKDPIPWIQAQEIIRETGMPEPVFDTIIYAAETHGYASSQPSF